MLTGGRNKTTGEGKGGKAEEAKTKIVDNMGEKLTPEMDKV